jgi:tRNA dimethylallyltransferase
MKNKKPKILFLMGPTASGKTDLAIALREQLPVELISVDSALVYKELNIGSAKPSAQEQAQAPHRLIDICDPAQPYSVAEFYRDAMCEIRSIHDQDRIPLLVGGTMMYFKALLEGLADMPATDLNVRGQIEADAETFGWPYVHQQLADVDPEIAADIHPNHSQRISRALEVFRSSGKTMSEFRAQQSESSLCKDYDVRQVAIAPHERSVLHQRIALRFNKMLEQGLIEEVQALKSRGDLHGDLPAIRAVGYRQVWDYLNGELSKTEMTERGIIATRQLAKRQLTWLRGWPDLNWVYTDTESGEIRKKSELVSEILNYFSDFDL